MPLNYEKPQQPAPPSTRYERPKVTPPMKYERPDETPKTIVFENNNNQKGKK